ncbi:MAG: AAA family ATPase, partial [Thermomicrobiales bacterium]
VPDGNIVFRHSFVVAGRGQSPISEYEVAKETLRIDYSASDGSSSELVSVERHGTIVTAIGGMSHPATRLVLPNYLANGTGSLQQLLQLLFSPLEFVSDRLRLISPAFGEFAQHMARAKAFQLVAPECRKSAAPTPFAEMQSSGRNLPALVYHLREHFPLSWEKVMRNMAFIVPDLVEIDVQPTQDRLWTLRFSEADTQQEWTVSEVSDGTIRSLALFAAAFDPRSSLIAVEEPENSVHPWILRVFVDICRQVSGSDIEPRKQILVTTHSPVLIDHLEPSEISMVWREQGRTQLRPLTELEPHLVDDWREGNVSLFEVLDSGLLRQAVPTA